MAQGERRSPLAFLLGSDYVATESAHWAAVHDADSDSARTASIRSARTIALYPDLHRIANMECIMGEGHAAGCSAALLVSSQALLKRGTCCPLLGTGFYGHRH
jgi:hypothetical protein